MDWGADTVVQCRLESKVRHELVIEGEEVFLIEAVFVERPTECIDELSLKLQIQLGKGDFRAVGNEGFQLDFGDQMLVYFILLNELRQEVLLFDVKQTVVAEISAQSQVVRIVNVLQIELVFRVGGHFLDPLLVGDLLVIEILQHPELGVAKELQRVASGSLIREVIDEAVGEVFD